MINLWVSELRLNIEYRGRGLDKTKNGGKARGKPQKNRTCSGVEPGSAGSRKSERST